VAVAVAATITVACGGGGRKRVMPACAADNKAVVRTAVAEYVRRASPTPQRFLTAAGTDSALPEGGVLALQDKGPTYFYLADPAKQRQVRKQLESVGAYATLLVVYHGMTNDSAGAPVVNLGGHYIGGPLDGHVAPKRTIRFRCDSAAWRVASADSSP
jgi:hypothetical protein